MFFLPFVSVMKSVTCVHIVPLSHSRFLRTSLLVHNEETIVVPKWKFRKRDDKTSMFQHEVKWLNLQINCCNCDQINFSNSFPDFASSNHVTSMSILREINLNVV